MQQLMLYTYDFLTIAFFFSHAYLLPFKEIVPACQQTAIENTENLKMIKELEFAKDVACKESRESHGILKKY